MGYAQSAQCPKGLPPCATHWGCGARAVEPHVSETDHISDHRSRQQPNADSLPADNVFVTHVQYLVVMPRSGVCYVKT